MANYLKTELYELIKKDERIFDFIQEGSLDGLWYWDLDNPENEWMNPRFWQVLGYNPKEMPHKASAWQDIVNQDDLKLALDNFQKHVADANHPYDQEVRYTHKNGSTVWVRCRGMAIRDKNGKPIRMLGAHQDITGLKNTEKKLQQECKKVKDNEELYRFLAENSTDVIRYQLPSGKFSYVSPNIFELSGYTAEEYAKFGPLENVVTEDHSILQQAVENLRKGEEIQEIEYRIYHKTGAVIWLESRIKAVLDEKGKTISLLSSTNKITEQKVLQIELAESEEKYRSIFNTAPLAIQSLDGNGNIIEINPHWLNILEYEKEEVIGKWFGNFLHPDFVEHFEKKFPEFKKRGFVKNVQYQMKKKNGEYIFVSFEGCIGYTPEGEFKQTYCTFKDITTEKEAELKLKESEERYRLILENSMDAILLTANDGSIFSANIAATKMFQRSEEEICKLGRNKLIDLDDHRLPVLLKERESTGNVVGEINMLRKDGTKFPVELSSSVFTDRNGKQLASMIIRDITERMVAQEEVQKQRDIFETVINSVPARIFWKDKNSVYLGCNPNFALDAGVKSIDDVIGQRDEAFVWGKDAEHYRASDREIMETGKAKLQIEEPFIGIDGEEIIWETNKMPLKNNKGETIGVLATSSNITSRKQAEYELKKKQYHLENAQLLGKIGSWDLDVEKDELIWTDENYRIFGVAIGTPLTYEIFLSRVHPDDREYVDEKWTAAMRGEKAYDITHRLMMDDGAVKWVRQKAELEFSDSGDCLRGIGFTQDITERKQAEESLKHSEEKFKSVFDYANAGIGLADATGKQTDANEELLQMLGYTRNEYLQLNFADVTHPDDIDTENNLLNQIHKGKKDNYRIEKRLRKKNGNYIWVDVSIKARRNQKGRVDNFIAMISDIDEKKKATETMNVFFDQPMNIHLIGSINGEIRKVNKGWEETLGYTKEESVGKNIFDFVHPKDKESTLNELSGLEDGKTTFYFENRYKHKNGTYVTLAWSAIFNTSGKMLHGVAKDITQQKAYHEALLKSEENYRALSENANHIIITHDFNGKINYANKYALDFIGITKKQALDTDIKQFITKPEEIKDLSGRINDFKNGIYKVYNYEVSVKLKSGEKRILEVLGSRIKFQNKIDSVLITAYDITYKKEAELKIKEQNEEYETLNEELRNTNDELFTSIRKEEEINERFNLAIEATHEGIFDWNLINNEIYYSPRWKSMLGYEDNELPNDFSVWEKLTKSEDVKKSWDMLNQLINRDIDKFDMEFKMQHKKGHWIDVHSRAKVFFNKEEKAIRVVGTHTDITLRKLAETKLIESQEKLKLNDSRYRKAEEIGKVGNWEYNIQTEIFWASDESKRIYGFELEENKFTTENVESCIPARERVHQALVDLIERGKQYDLEFEIIAHNTGERKTITSIAELIKDKYGKPQKIVGVIQDITVRKETENKIRENEEKLRHAIDNSPLGICINDMKGNFISTNKAYQKIVGYTKDELKQMSFFDITHPDFSPKNRELFNAMASNKAPDFNIEKKYIKKDGSTIDVRINAAAVYDNQKKPLFGMAFTEDITWQKQAENDLIAAKERAEEANRLKTEFLHNMSHEIRTPMNGIMGFSSLLCNIEGQTEEQKNYTSIIQNSSKQLLHIIDDILEISTLETKQLSIQESEFDVNLFILELFSIYDLKSKEMHLPLYVKKGLQNGSSLIISDKSKIHKILSNLLDNAFKFTSSGKIEFGYKLEYPNIVFYVKDTGVGISDNKQTIIFERFSQESSQTAQNFGGLGLGLSIAKENTELLGGELTVESTKGKGSTFYVRIPYNASKKAKINGTTDLNDKVEASDVITILVAEDEEVNYLYLEAILENASNHKIKLHHAINGKEAVDKCLSKHLFDLVLMDIKMPVMNGYLATKKIKAVKPELPIIAQTAYSTTSERDMALKYGCDDFISKPINKEKLLLLISKYLKRD